MGTPTAPATAIPAAIPATIPTVHPAVSGSNIDWARIRADFPVLQREVHGKPLVYLDSANFVTGEILHVDGGQSAGH